MSLQELCEAIILEEDEELDIAARFCDPHCILEICPSLLDFDRHWKTLGLAHSSVFDYVAKFVKGKECKAAPSLLSDDTMDLDVYDTAADAKIASICLSYLLQPEFSVGWLDMTDELDMTDDNALERRLEAWPLSTYAVFYLWPHLSNVNIEGSMSRLLKQFIESHKLPRCGNFGAFLQIYYSESISGPRIQETTPLYWAARSGNLEIVRMMLKSGNAELLEQKGGRCACTPLHVASWAGHKEIVEELLSAGADVWERNEFGESGLDYAILAGNHGIVELLQKAGAQPSVHGVTIDKSDSEDGAA